MRNLFTKNGFLIGLALWLLLLAAKSMAFWTQYLEAAVIGWAAVVLVPMGVWLLRDYLPAFIPKLWWAGLFALIAYYRYPAPDAVWWAVLYGLWAVSAFLGALVRTTIFNIFSVTVLAVFAYWLTAVVWLLFFLAGIRPLGFDPVITHLTAAHFHLAGFVLSASVVLLARHYPCRVHQLLLWPVLAGMPLVAAGIVYSHFGGSPLLETFSGVFFAAFAVAVVWRHLVTGRQVLPVVRWLWIVAGVSLVFGGILGGLYALRVYFPLEWVTLENMKIFHGAVNAIGFGGACLGGWFITSPRG